MTILGCYWAPGHQRPTDIDYMTRLQSPAIRVLDPDVNQMSIAHKAAPNALLLPRDWALSEQHDDVRRDPVGTGKRHAQDWRNKIAVWRATGLKLPPDNQIIVVGINEMQVWTMLPQAVEYTVAMLDECTNLGLRACALNLSVGWPANTGADTPPDWKPYAPIEAAIKRGNHILVLHEYWYKSGPQDGAGWWAWRHHACPWDVPIIIGECGVDLYVDMQRFENDGKPNRGWRGNISPDQYAAQMEQYARGCDTRVIAILPFLTDYRSNNWESFDTAEAHPHFLARADSMTPQAKFAPLPTQPQHPEGPTPAPSGPVAVPVTPAGARIRSGPGKTYSVLGAVAKGVPIVVTGIDPTGTWYRVQTPLAGPDGVGWVSATVVSVEGVDDVPVVEPVVTPTPTQPVTPALSDKWNRAWPIVLKIEGGLSTDRSDKGNYRPDGTFVGTKWGISALSHPDVDIANLSKEDALKIYHRDYWLASGSDRLEWPLALVHFDSYVQNQSAAKKFLATSNGDPDLYLAERIDWYTELTTWNHHGRGWMRRCATMLREVAKAKVSA